MRTNRSFLKGRRAAVLAFATVIVAMGGVAYGAIPSTSGVITSCYNKSSGAVRFVDETVACTTSETRLAFNQLGRTGPQGLQGIQGLQGLQGIQGVKGDKGDPGTSNIHWAKFDGTGKLLASSEPTQDYYANSWYTLVKFSGVDLKKCAVTVQAADSQYAMTTWSEYYGYIYARSVKVVAGGTTAAASGVSYDIVANCNTN